MMVTVARGRSESFPSPAAQVTHLRSDALFVLLVEKDAAFMRLAEDRFYNRFPCIILTAKGQPDVASRLFLNKLKTELKIPILAVVDSDPYGLKILSVYMQVRACALLHGLQPQPAHCRAHISIQYVVPLV
jgi:meiotic recombination protein SPO11